MVFLRVGLLVKLANTVVVGDPVQIESSDIGSSG